MNQRLEKLLDAYFDEALSAQEQAELEYFLLSSPQARDFFWQRARFHALIRRCGAESWGKVLAKNLNNKEAQVPAISSCRSGFKLFMAWLRNETAWVTVGAIAVIALGFISWIYWAKSGQNNVVARHDSKESVKTNSDLACAQLVRMVDVKWSNPTNGFSVGSVLLPGSLKLSEGLIELQFYRGARVIVEGPAEFDLVSDKEAQCRFGKIRAEVPPPAHGFKVISPNLDVIDLGTSFGMDVHNNGLAEVHVFEGKIKMASMSNPKEEVALTQGESTLVDTAGQFQPARTITTNYVSFDEVERRVRAEMKKQFYSWRDYSQRLAQDPSLLLYYNFEGLHDGTHVVQNLAPNATPESCGTLIGCEITQGRWPEKKALDFRQFGDRIRFTLPEKLNALTCMAWLRVDSLSHNFNAILMSGDADAGEIQWQLSKAGNFMFGKRILSGWGDSHLENYPSDPIITPASSGLWIHMAIVYDLSTHTIREYYNGKEILHQDTISQSPLILNSLEIGNWTPHVGQPFELARNFSGRLDEFAIFGRALSADEIQDAYLAGQNDSSQ